MPEILVYQQVLVCEKVPIQKLVSAGRGRKRRLKVVFKWRCRATMRPKNISEYPIMNLPGECAHPRCECMHGPEDCIFQDRNRRKIKLTVIE